MYSYLHTVNFIIRVEWMELKKVYKELQKKQMSQLKETMKEQSSIAKLHEDDFKDDSNVNLKEEQGAKIEDSTSTKLLVETSNCEEINVTVEITMSTLPADEVEVRTYIS